MISFFESNWFQHTLYMIAIPAIAFIVFRFLAEFRKMKISYDSDSDKAIEIMGEEAIIPKYLVDGRKEVDILAGKPKVLIRTAGISRYSVNLRATGSNNDPGIDFELKSDLYCSLKLSFGREHIEIPVSNRTIVEKKNGKVT